MAAPVQPEPVRRPEPRRPERPGQGVPGGAAAAQPMQVPGGSPPIGQATTTQPKPPAQQITAGSPTAPYAAQAQQRAAALQGVAQTAPDRTALAQNTLSRYIESTNPDFQNQLRTVGQDAAKFGRIGAGMTTTRLGDVASNRNTDIINKAGELADSAAGQTLDDRLKLAQNALAQYSAFQGADQSANELALAGELGRGNLGVAQGQLGVAQGQLGVAQGRLGLDTQLGNDKLALDKLLGLGQLDVSRQNANTNSTSVSNDAAYRDAQLALQRYLGDQTNSYNTARLAQDQSQYDTSDQFRRLQADRDFLLDDRTAAAMAALDGYDLTGTSTSPTGGSTQPAPVTLSDGTVIDGNTGQVISGPTTPVGSLPVSRGIA